MPIADPSNPDTNPDPSPDAASAHSLPILGEAPAATLDPDEPGTGPQVYLETFGCQMNELDSELVRGQLGALGYRFTRERTHADVIIYNTCSVREQAENKALSRIGKVGVEKRDGRQVILGVIGCLAEREGRALMRRFPQVDLLCGPGELDRLPLLIDNATRAEAATAADRIALQGSTSRRSTTLSAADDSLELLDRSRAFDPDSAGAGGRSAYVRITRGCNKFCTYCVVPNTRGAEIHRPPDAIVDECRRLADAGVLEITLLGQTVNHYVYVHGASVAGGLEVAQVGPGAAAFRAGDGGASLAATGQRVTTFANLLHRIHEAVPEILRLRFVTSFPRDFGDDILEVMAASPRICNYLHVPAQSGSTAVLDRMNRGYSREQYLEFIERARRIIPDVSIAGDIIVGFSGETDAEFAETRTLMEAVGFKNNFIFKYSPRPGTSAWGRLPDDVPEDVKRIRNNELLGLQAEISARVHASMVGQTRPVFVEKVSAKSASRQGNVELGWVNPVVQLSGRTEGDLIAVFDLEPGVDPASVIGQIVPVRIVASAPLLLQGVLARIMHEAKRPADEPIA